MDHIAHIFNVDFICGTVVVSCHRAANGPSVGNYTRLLRLKIEITRMAVKAFQLSLCVTMYSEIFRKFNNQLRYNLMKIQPITIFDYLTRPSLGI